MFGPGDHSEFYINDSELFANTILLQLVVWTYNKCIIMYVFSQQKKNQSWIHCTLFYIFFIAADDVFWKYTDEK